MKKKIFYQFWVKIIMDVREYANYVHANFYQNSCFTIKYLFMKGKRIKIYIFYLNGVKANYQDLKKEDIGVIEL